MGLKKNRNNLFILMLGVTIFIIIITGITIFITMKYETGFFRYIAYCVCFMLIFFYVPLILMISSKVRCPHCGKRFNLIVPEYCPKCQEKV